jgi:Zn-dependent peptidase ImmA (M78 family)
VATWAALSRLALLEARRLHTKLEIDISTPIDVFEAIEDLGLLLAFFPMQSASGAYIAEPGARPGILVNSQHPLSRQRYTAAHELGHHVLGHGTLADAGQPLHRMSCTATPDYEKAAEAFASWFLMPRGLVNAQLAEMGVREPSRPEEVYELALRIGASYEATAWHLVDLNRSSLYRTRQLLKTKPRAVKLRLADGEAPDDLRNDVWPLDHRSSGRTIDVRAGDRIVLRLDEQPALGERWSTTATPGTVRLEEETAEPIEDLSGLDTAVRPVGTALRHTFLLTAVDGADDTALGLSAGEVSDQTFTLHVRVYAPRRGVREEQLLMA